MTKEDIIAILEAGIVIGNEVQKRDVMIQQLKEELNKVTKVVKE